MKATPARKKRRWVTSDGGDQVADQAGDRDRVRRQPRLDQALAGVGAKLLAVAGLAAVAAAGGRCAGLGRPGGADESIES